MRRIFGLLGIILLVVTTAWVGLGYRAAGERDVQRERDLRTIRTQLTAPDASIPEALPPGAPAPQRPDHPYLYTVRDGAFMACVTFERTEVDRALFVTANGEFRADRHYCRADFDPRIAAIISDAKLTDAAITPFLAAAPELADAATVKAQCQTAGPNEVLFGCYLPSQKIWILRVTDPALAGLETVTAVHELLHALEAVDAPPADRLQAAAAAVGDSQLTEELSVYDETERTSELDARLGTEYANLPVDLEAYYQKYFDRAVVVRRYQAYGQLAREVTSLRLRLDNDRTRLDALRAGGEVDAYNAQVDDYNALVRRYNGLAERYNLTSE